MNFSPRLTQILILLLNSENPIPAKVLAEKLQISKRTLSREFKNVDKDLERYNLKIDKKSKEGISINGSSENKKKLEEYLDGLECFDPKNIHQRQEKIIEEILILEEISKSYYLSSMLGVSETTINNDLNNVKEWFDKNNIKLIKKSGVGIYIEYDEENYRNACIRYILSDINNAMDKLAKFVDKYIILNIKEILSDIDDNRIDRMESLSYIELIVCLSIYTSRIIKRKNISSKYKLKDKINSGDSILMNEIILKLENKFNIKYSEYEIMAIYLYIAGSKILEPVKDNGLYKNNDKIIKIIYEMIEKYDSDISYYLKQDDNFVNGLLAHLKPTIIRLEHGIKIINPYNKEIKNTYPEIYKRAEKCVDVIRKYTGFKVPEEEIGLISMHFGGAEVRLGEKYKRLRKVRLGIVCGSGIGISTLLCSRMIHIFGDRIEVKRFSIRDLDYIEKNEIDIMISTLDLKNYDKKYIKVSPILKEEDVSLISNAIDNIKEKPGEVYVKDTYITEEIDKIALSSKEISSIIKNFKIYKKESDIDFNSVIKFAGDVACEDIEGKMEIADRLIKREQLSTQMISEFEITLLHTKSRFIKSSKFFAINPIGESFDNFMKSRTILVMLIPEEDPRQTLSISNISSAIFEDEIFLESIKNGDEEKTGLYIERILTDYLVNQVKGL